MRPQELIQLTDAPLTVFALPATESEGADGCYLNHLKTLGEVHASIEPADETLPKVTRVKVRMLNRVWRGTFDEVGDLIHEELY